MFVDMHYISLIVCSTISHIAILILIKLGFYSISLGDLIELSTVEPPNKGHFGDNINSAVGSFVERLSSLWRFKMY